MPDQGDWEFSQAQAKQAMLWHFNKHETYILSSFDNDIVVMFFPGSENQDVNQRQEVTTSYFNTAPELWRDIAHDKMQDVASIYRAVPGQQKQIKFTAGADCAPHRWEFQIRQIPIDALHALDCNGILHQHYLLTLCQANTVPDN